MSWHKRRYRSHVPSPEISAACDAMTVENMYLIRNKGDYGITKTFGIMCQGKRHKITLRQRGPITLDNHSIREERIMMKLGDGSKPKCLMFFDEWTNKGTRYSRHGSIKSSAHKIPRDIHALQYIWREKRHVHRASFIDILVDEKIGQRLLRRLRLWHEDIEGRIGRQFNIEQNYNLGELSQELFPSKIHVSFSSKFSPQKGEE